MGEYLKPVKNTHFKLLLKIAYHGTSVNIFFCKIEMGCMKLKLNYVYTVKYCSCETRLD